MATNREDRKKNPAPGKDVGKITASPIKVADRWLEAVGAAIQTAWEIADEICSGRHRKQPDEAGLCRHSPIKPADQIYVHMTDSSCRLFAPDLRVP